MKDRSKAIVILTILFGYVLIQFIWWEILLVKQTGTIIEERQRLAELSISSEEILNKEVEKLHRRKTMQTMMIVGEGTVFLLLLLFGIYKIKQAQDRELALTSQQNNFFLSITHELKTPVAATKLQLQTLQKRKLDQATQEQLIKNALRETERLNVLIDNVLLASRLGSGEMKLNREKVNIVLLSEEILSRYFGDKVKEGAVVLRSTQEEVISQLDTQAYTSVLCNLVENALKYSGTSGPIEVLLGKEKNKALLAVSDQGKGIGDEEKKKIFERFYRSGDEDTRSSRGTGLGLYIVKNLVERHKGTVTVKDNQPQGTCFEVRFDVA